MKLSPTAQRLVDAWGPTVEVRYREAVASRCVAMLQDWTPGMGWRTVAAFLEPGETIGMPPSAYFRTRPSEAVKAAWARKSGVSQRRGR